MIGATISHHRILEKLPTSFLRNGTPSGQVGGGGMSRNCLRALPQRAAAISWISRFQGFRSTSGIQTAEPLFPSGRCCL